MKKNILAFLPVLLICSLIMSTSSMGGQKIYKDIEEDSNTFTGIESSTSYKNQNTISIGIFHTHSPDHSFIQKIEQKARDVIRQRNEIGGIAGRKIKLISRHNTSPWTAASSEIVNMVYQDGIVALLTLFSTDSHLAAQIAAKSYVPVISIGSSDSTLNQARIPWVFRLPPSDENQAKSLLQSCKKYPSCKPGIVSSTRQDSRLGTQELIKELSKNTISPAYHHTLDPEKPDTREKILIKTVETNPQQLFIYADQDTIIECLSFFDNRGWNKPVFLPWTPGLNISHLAKAYKGTIHTVDPVFAPSLKAAPNGDFTALPILVYVEDALHILFEAIREAGNDRSGIRSYLGDTRQFFHRRRSYTFNNGGGNTWIPATKIIRRKNIPE